MIHKLQSALVIVGHGSTVNPDSSGPTWSLAREISERVAFGEVHCAFWKEEPSLRQVLHCCDRDEVYVVPNFISEGYFTRTVIPRELNLTGAVTRVGRHTVKYCAPVGSNSRMTELLLKRAAEVAPGVPASETSLFIVGHGTGLNDNSAVAAKREVEQIRALGRYGEVIAAYMEEEPLIAKWDELSTKPNVVVVPFFIADGLHSYEDIPVLLGIADSSPGAASGDAQSIFAKNPYRLRCRTLFYASSIGTEPGFADAILDQVEAFEAGNATTTVDDAPVEQTALPLGTAEDVMRVEDSVAALGKWIGPGPRIFGQVLISRVPARVELRHVDDAGREDLELFEDAEAARTLANFDDEGRYRPLKTAPNLRHGWRMEFGTGGEVFHALSFFYPAMFPIWQSHREGELVPVNLRETLARQTGMYRVTQKLTDEQAQRVIAQTCCATSCMKTILWRLDARQAISSLPAEKFTPGSTAARMPLLCHEACNLLVAAARKAVKGEAE